MSAKNRDNKNRWRNITVGFRVSPEENELIMILSILVDTFISKISLTMQPGPKIDSISGA